MVFWGKVVSVQTGAAFLHFPTLQKNISEKILFKPLRVPGMAVYLYRQTIQTNIQIQRHEHHTGHSHRHFDRQPFRRCAPIRRNRRQRIEYPLPQHFCRHG